MKERGKVMPTRAGGGPGRRDWTGRGSFRALAGCARHPASYRRAVLFYFPMTSPSVDAAVPRGLQLSVPISELAASVLQQAQLQHNGYSIIFAYIFSIFLKLYLLQVVQAPRASPLRAPITDPPSQTLQRRRRLRGHPQDDSQDPPPNSGAFVPCAGS